MRDTSIQVLPAPAQASTTTRRGAGRRRRRRRPRGCARRRAVGRRGHSAPAARAVRPPAGEPRERRAAHCGPRPSGRAGTGHALRSTRRRRPRRAPAGRRPSRRRGQVVRPGHRRAAAALAATSGCSIALAAACARRAPGRSPAAGSSARPQQRGIEGQLRVLERRRRPCAFSACGAAGLVVDQLPRAAGRVHVDAVDAAVERDAAEHGDGSQRSASLAGGEAPAFGVARMQPVEVVRGKALEAGAKRQQLRRVEGQRGLLGIGRSGQALQIRGRCVGLGPRARWKRCSTPCSQVP